MNPESPGSEAAILDTAALGRWDKLGKDLVARLIDAFLESAPKRLEACRFKEGGEDFQAVANGAHTLKSSAGNLGAKRLQAVCERLEETAEKRLGAETAALSGELEGIFTRTLEALQREREGRKA